MYPTWMKYFFRNMSAAHETGDLKPAFIFLCYEHLLQRKSIELRNDHNGILAGLWLYYLPLAHLYCAVQTTET